jgi:hypothetical protein
VAVACYKETQRNSGRKNAQRRGCRAGVDVVWCSYVLSSWPHLGVFLWFLLSVCLHPTSVSFHLFQTCRPEDFTQCSASGCFCRQGHRHLQYILRCCTPNSILKTCCMWCSPLIAPCHVKHSTPNASVPSSACLFVTCTTTNAGTHRRLLHDCNMNLCSVYPSILC